MIFAARRDSRGISPSAQDARRRPQEPACQAWHPRGVVARPAPAVCTAPLNFHSVGPGAATWTNGPGREPPDEPRTMRDSDSESAVARVRSNRQFGLRLNRLVRRDTRARRVEGALRATRDWLARANRGTESRDLELGRRRAFSPRRR